MAEKNQLPPNNQSYGFQPPPAYDQAGYQQTQGSQQHFNPQEQGHQQFYQPQGGAQVVTGEIFVFLKHFSSFWNLNKLEFL